MKRKITPIKPRYTFLLSMTLTLLFVNCGTVDNLGADSFNFFGNDGKNKHSEFRSYSDNSQNQSPLIEFILDKEDPVSINYNGNLRKVCNYTKLPYKTTEIKNWDTTPIFSSTTRVFCITNTIKLSDAAIDKITEFVTNGGTLFLPNANEDIRLSYLLGFKPEAEHFTDITSKGFQFKEMLLPGFNNTEVVPIALHYGFDKDNFSDNIKVLATAINNPKYPSVLENPVGNGRVILFNTQKSFQKRDRGFLFSGILKGLEGVPYPIANVSTIFLDDFPCPLFDIKSEPIASEMNLTATDFVKKVWWPDMLKLAKKYNISYSVMLTFDYKNKVDPPFIFDQWDNHLIRDNGKVVGLSEWFVKDAAKNGHELAFHGYNHVELMKNLWHNPQFIETSLSSVKKKWEVSDFGPLPVTYVPPTNNIDNAGIIQLKKSMPSLKYLCSSYNGVFKEGSNREFDIEPFNNYFFDYPRVTDGFYLDSDMEYSQKSLYLFTGIWTHFLHPDDVYQIHDAKNKSQGDYDLRNALNLGWRKTKGQNRGMYSEFDNYLKATTTYFPQIRFLNGGEAANIVLDWRASGFEHKSKNGIYTVEELKPEESISGNQYWFLYVSSNNVQRMEDAMKNQVVRFSKTPYLDGFLYTIYTSKSKLSLPDLNYKTESQKVIAEEISQKVKSDILVYQEKVKQFIIEVNEGPEDADNKLKLEIVLLKQKMLTDAKIDPTLWNKYTEYMTWDNKEFDVWKLLEEHCLKYPMPENIMYSKELNTIVEYPNDLIREKWLAAQMLVTPNDAALLNDYVASFYTPENQAKIKIALTNLLKVDTGFYTYLQYLQYLLSYETNTALEELSQTQPDEKFKSIATDIVWLYADNDQLKKAYDWSKYSDEINFETKMYWLVELKSYAFLEEEYKKYIEDNPSDYKAKAAMSSVYYEIEKFKEAWVLANSLPESSDKENLRAMYNKDVIYVDSGLQQDLLQNYSAFFYPDIKKALMLAIRKETGNFIAFDSSLGSNKKDPAAFKSMASYNIYDKKKNLHSFGTTFSKIYKVKFETDDEDNVDHTLYGLQYQFNNPKNYEKLQYWSSIRGEYSDFGKLYFQLGLGANYSKNKKFTSAEFKIFPAETGAAYSKNIYRMQGNLYQDAYLFGVINTSLSFEGNYYTPSKSGSVVETKRAIEVSAIGKVILDSGKDKKSKLLPFVEASYLKSSIRWSTRLAASGYPYWIIANRFYAGGGLGWKFGKEESNFNTRIEAGYFDDDYSDEFERFIGEMSCQIFDYTAITASLEVYSQSKYYSNVIQFGVKYNLKKKQKK